MDIKIKKTDSGFKMIADEDGVYDLSELKQFIESLSVEESKEKKKLCRKGSPYHDSQGRFSTKKGAKSWSVRVGGKNCKHGQRKQNPSRWTRVPCGRADASDPDKKAAHKCKDGSANEAVEPTNCKITGRDSKFKQATDSKPARIEIDKSFDCGIKHISPDEETQKKIDKIKSSDTENSGDKVAVSKQMFDRFLQFIDKSDPKQEIEEVDKEGNLNRNEKINSRFPGWSEMISLSKGIH
jgi:hypothetical protein